ncbi:MAG: catalase [Hyphomicrobiaceae bacterium]|nr:catalase [Hyphomicrobiaceae bacterium]
MTPRSLATTSAVALSVVALAAMSPATAKDPQAFVDTLNAISGKQASGQRASHAKGQCVKGTFTSAPGAGAVTAAFAYDTPVPVLGRFSMGGGNPKISDGTKTAVRGFAFKIDPDGKQTNEFAMVNSPVHFAANFEQMFGFVQARVPGADGKPDPEKIKAFGDANPATKAQGAYLASKPVPASYAGVHYWGIHGYQTTGKGGEKGLHKFKLVTAAEAGLTDDEAKAKPADFLVGELTERLAKGPASFTLVAIAGKAGDKTDDLTKTWDGEDARPTITIGTLSVTAIEPNATCDASIFDPTNVAKGLAPSPDDTLFAPRSPAYAISLSRRAAN